jgi:branched-chain amino acid transport system permease protein
VYAVALGSLYGLAASGLVVTYATSGVFNFAQGAIGMFMAYIYWQLTAYGLPEGVALVVVVLGVAPLFGAFIYRAMMKHLAGTDLLVQLVATVGLMLGLMGLAQLLWNPETYRNVNFFFGADSGIQIFGTLIIWQHVIDIGAGIGVAIVLRLLLFRTRIGISMRAVVDNSGLARLNGASPDRASSLAWALGSSLAAISGILLAPELLLNIDALTLLIISSFAAAVIGRLRNLPMTFMGGLLLGVITSFSLSFLNFTKYGQGGSGVNAALPAILLIVVLMVQRGSGGYLQVKRSVKSIAMKTSSLRGSVYGMSILVCLMVASVALPEVDQNWVGLALVYAVVLLALVPLAGWLGEANLGIVALVGAGSYAMVEIAGLSGNPLGILAAIGLGFVFGALMAAPAVRLGGIYLALGSVAFASIAETLFFDQPAVFGNSNPDQAPLDLFGYHVNTSYSVSLLCVVAFVIVGFGIIGLRRTPLGRRMIAIRESPSASVSLGISIPRTRLAVYCLCGAIAGLAGALLALQQGTVGETNFTMLGGLQYLLLIVIGGVTFVGGAFAGGVFAVLLIVIQTTWQISWLNSLELLGPGLAALAIARTPNGFVAQLPIQIAFVRRKAEKIWRRSVSTDTTDPNTHQASVAAVNRKLLLSGRNSRAGVGAHVSKFAPNVDAATVMELRGISVSFGGIHALRHVDLAVESSAITGLIGPNGAGKTTLFETICGVVRPDEGVVEFLGENIGHLRPDQRARSGIARTYQQLEGFGALSVGENLLVALESGGKRDRVGRASQERDELLEAFGLHSVAEMTVSELPTGLCRLLEIACAVAIRPRLILLDEPSAGLNAEETQDVEQVIVELAAAGIAIVLIEHDMSLIMRACSKIAVLNLGEVIAFDTPLAIRQSPLVATAYLGEAASGALTAADNVEVHAGKSGLSSLATLDNVRDRPTEPETRVPVLELRDVHASYGSIEVLHGVSFSVYPGQTVALLGPNGAGKSTTIKVATGQISRSRGDVLHNGQPLNRADSRGVALSGICTIPERQAVFPRLTVTENLAMASHGGQAIADIEDRAYETFPILRERRHQFAGTLSGGEQRMLSLVRALSWKSKLIVLDELSLGLAPLIVDELYEIINSMRNEGVALLIVEQFIDKVLDISDYVVLMLHGRIEAHGTPEAMSANLVGAYLSGEFEKVAGE